MEPPFIVITGCAEALHGYPSGHSCGHVRPRELPGGQRLVLRLHHLLAVLGSGRARHAGRLRRFQHAPEIIVGLRRKVMRNKLADNRN